MSLPPGFRDQWIHLSRLSGVQVVRQILEHERVTRPDVQTALEGVIISELKAEQLLEAVRNTSRHALAKSILEGFRDWRLWIPTAQQLLEVGIWRDIHFRKDLAPVTGTLREAGETLALRNNPSEFDQVIATWESGVPSLGGLTAVWVNPDELGLIEGCHRLIAFSSLVHRGWTPPHEPSFEIAVGRP